MWKKTEANFRSNGLFFPFFRFCSFSTDLGTYLVKTHLICVCFLIDIFFVEHVSIIYCSSLHNMLGTGTYPIFSSWSTLFRSYTTHVHLEYWQNVIYIYIFILYILVPKFNQIILWCFSYDGICRVSSAFSVKKSIVSLNVPYEIYEI